jgi:hypothetical protein
MEKVGREKFSIALKEIAIKYKEAHINVEEFQKEIEKSTKENLEEFFKSYVYGGKLP